MASFGRLAQVEVQLVMQHCDKVTLLQLARCSRATLAAASHSFAWRSLSPLELRCDSPIDLSSHVSQSLLRRADLSVHWDTHSHAFDSHDADGDMETEEQRNARAEAEAVALAALPGLRRLEAWGYSIDLMRLCSALLAHFDDGGALTSLRLHLRDRHLQPADCELLCALAARSCTLTALDAEGNFDSDAIRCLANAVSQSRTLATLSLSRHLDDEGAVALAAAVARCRTLTDLQLFLCGIRDAGIKALVSALCQEDSHVITLNLGHNSFGPAGTASVADLLARDRCVLQSLDLSYCSIGDDGAKSLANALRTNRSLTELQLSENRMEAEGFAALIAALQSNPHIALRHLDLSHNRVDVTGAAALAAYLRTLTRIDRLDLAGCSLDDAAVGVLVTCLSAARSLRELRLSQNDFSVASATALASGIGSCPSLTLLDVNDNESLGDDGLAALTPALARLRLFDAGNCSLTDDGAASLASLLQSSRQLHALDLYSNSFGRVGIAAITEALDSSSSLQSLNLWSCDVDAEGAAALGEALCRGWAVTDLRLGSNQQIGDDGARALASALERCASSCSLRTLDLEDCDLTGAGALVLVRAAAAVPSLRLLALSSNGGIQAANKPALLAACATRPHLQLELSS